MKKVRLRRPKPKRTAPIRNPAMYFQESDSWDAGRDGATKEQSKVDNPSDSFDDVVAKGVKLGYQVIEDYIRQGRAVADRFRKAAFGKEKKKKEEKDLVQQVSRLYKDMADICIDAALALVRSPDFLAGMAGTKRENGVDTSKTRVRSPRASRDNGSGPVVIEIASLRRTQVVLDLPSYPDHYTPIVHGLHASDPDLPPLREISFQRDKKSARHVLRLKIPNRHPAAVYTGVIADKETNSPKGTLSVRILN